MYSSQSQRDQPARKEPGGDFATFVKQEQIEDVPPLDPGTSSSVTSDWMVSEEYGPAIMDYSFTLTDPELATSSRFVSHHAASMSMGGWPPSLISDCATTPSMSTGPSSTGSAGSSSAASATRSASMPEIPTTPMSQIPAASHLVKPTDKNQAHYAEMRPVIPAPITAPMALAAGNDLPLEFGHGMTLDCDTGRTDKRQRNAQSARRSRARQTLRMATLESKCETLSTDNMCLRYELDQLKAKVTRLQEKLRVNGIPVDRN